MWKPWVNGSTMKCAPINKWGPCRAGRAFGRIRTAISLDGGLTDCLECGILSLIIIKERRI